MNTHGRKWIRDRKRLAIYLRDGLRCQWCGRGIQDGASLTLDHAKPRKRGGTNAHTNLFTACHPCNSRRQDMSVRGFAAQGLGLDPLGNDPALEGLINAIRWTRRRELAPFLEQARVLLEGRGLTDAIRHVTTAP